MIVALAFGWPTICGRLQHELGGQPTVRGDAVLAGPIVI
jgi:hypothetical protein